MSILKRAVMSTAFLAAALAGCGGGGSNAPSNEADMPVALPSTVETTANLATLKVHAIDSENGDALAGAEVRIAGQASVTDSNGWTTLYLPPGKGLVLTVASQRRNHPIVARFDLEAGDRITYEAVFQNPQAPDALPAVSANGSVIEASNKGASVSLALADTFSGRTSGSESVLFPGDVNLKLTMFDPSRTAKHLPGMHLRRDADDGAEPVEILGVVHTDLVVAADGLPLALRPGRTAALRIPLPATADSGTPLTLYHLDEKDGTWKPKGLASLSKEGSVRYGNVRIDGFGSWMIGTPIVRASKVEGCVRMEDGSVPPPFTVLQVEGVGHGHAALSTVGVEGRFSAPAKSLATIELSAHVNHFHTEKVRVETQSQPIKLQSCLILKLDAVALRKENEARIDLLTGLWLDVLDMVIAPTEVLEEDHPARIKPLSQVCEEGLVKRARLNGRSVVGGEALPENQHNELDVEFDRCMNAVDGFHGRAVASVLMKRQANDDEDAFEVDIASTLHGLVNMEERLIARGWVTVSSAPYTAGQLSVTFGKGTVLARSDQARAMTFEGGEVSVTASASSGTRTSYRDLCFILGGVRYRLDGEITRVLNDGQPDRVLSGTVVLYADGTPVGRWTGKDGEPVFEALGEIEPF